MVQVDDRWQLNGLRALLVSNDVLRIVVLPELGGKIYSLEYRPRSREWLWRNARIDPGRVPFGSDFDNNWSGGADVLYPTCTPARWNGQEIPDSGEWWSVPWTYDIEPGGAGVTVTLTAGGRVLPARAKRTLRIDEGKPEIRLGFEISNVGNARFPFLLGFHPALAIEPGFRIDLPSGSVAVEHSSGPALGKPGMEYRWPHLADADGRARDMREVLPFEANVYAGHYFTADGGDVWWALRDPRTSTGLALVAPAADFVGLWMWIVYGGWRGHYHLALEPWTSFPIGLDEAVERTTARWLEPGETFSSSIRLVAFDGSGEVTGLSMTTPAEDFGRRS